MLIDERRQYDELILPSRAVTPVADAIAFNHWPRFRMRAHPTRGRYFPLSIGAFVTITRGWLLTSREPRLLRNPERAGFDASVDPIVRLRRGHDVTLFSLPASVEIALGARAAVKALDAVAAWTDAPPSKTRDYRQSIVVYLEERVRLRVVDHRVTLSRRKFGAGEGLATSSKGRVSSRAQVELALLSID
jgi:hypothetical protein